MITILIISLSKSPITGKKFPIINTIAIINNVKRTIFTKKIICFFITASRQQSLIE